MQAQAEQRFWNPYAAGVLLGLVLLTSFLVMGQGLGASGAVYRYGIAMLHALVPAHVEGNSYMAAVVADGASPFDSYFVFLAVGVFLGGVVSSYAAGRMKLGIRRGPRASVGLRLTLAFVGGILMGFAARLTRGCTSGQALSGGALLSVGSWIFMLSVFAGGYAVAYFVRRQWT
jgi:uncharacterized membrane protein YedE/YeeE